MALTFTDQQALFTAKYADKVESIIPEHTIVCDKVTFDERARIGDKYEVPIALTRSAGVTYNTGGGTYNLNSSITPRFERAKIQGSVIWVLDSISEEAITRGRGGEKQFISETKPVVENLFLTMAYRMELEALYGQVGLGRSAASAGNVTASGTTCTVIIDTPYWAPGIWLGSENAQFDIYAAIGDAAPTNATSALTLTGVNLSTRTLTFTCASADAAALEALGASILFFRGSKTGATTYAEAEGIHSLITKTSGTLHEINVATYSMWKGQTFGAGSAALSFSKLQSAVVGPVNAGLKQDVLALVSTKTWSNVANDQAALRSYDKSYSEKKLKNGAQALELHSQNGMIEIVAHPYVWEGFAYVIRPEKWKRVGSSEPHFPELGPDRGFYKVPSTNYYNIELTKDSALMTLAPATNVVIDGIVNS